MVPADDVDDVFEEESSLMQKVAETVIRNLRTCVRPLEKTAKTVVPTREHSANKLCNELQEHIQNMSIKYLSQALSCVTVSSLEDCRHSDISAGKAKGRMIEAEWLLGFGFFFFPYPLP